VSATCCLAEGFASRAAAYAASDTAYAAASAAAARHNLYPVASAALHTAARNAAQQEFNQMVAEAFAAIGVE
jgi:hypothetical protein